MGDCGGVCKLPLPFPSSLEISPSTTGLDLGQNVRVNCRKSTERFKLAPELSEAHLECVDATSLKQSSRLPSPPSAGASAGASAARKLGPSKGFLEAQPKSIWMAKVSYPIKNLAEVFECVADPCPYIGISGFESTSVITTTTTTATATREEGSNGDASENINLEFLNGVYERADSADGWSHYSQSKKNPILKELKLSPYHLRIDSMDFDLAAGDNKNRNKKDSSSSSNKIGRSNDQRQFNPSSLFWRISSVESDLLNNTKLASTSTLEVSAVSPPFHCKSFKSLPSPGQRINLKDCLGDSSEWSIIVTEKSETAKQKKSVERRAKVVHIKCIDKNERKELLKPKLPKAQNNSSSPSTGAVETSNTQNQSSSSSTGIKGFYENGVPITFFKLPSGEKRTVFCQDQPEVPQIAQMTCEEIVDAVGCDFLLSDTGRPVPDYLPKETVVGMICPNTCDLCVEECAAGCPIWFLRNLNCDPACNNAACEFDRGDCIGVSPLDIDAVPSFKERQVVNQTSDSEGSFAVTSNKTNSVNVEASTSNNNPSSLSICEDKNESLLKALGLSCSDLEIRANGKGGCEAQVLKIADLLLVRNEHQTTIGEGEILKPSTRVSDVCPKICNACNSELVEKKRVEECVDDAMITKFGYSCKLLKAVAVNKLNGCEARLLDIAAVRGDSITLPPGIPPIIRLIDACPVTCDCCDCPRFRRPKPGEAEKRPIVITLEEGEMPNCVDDKRVEEAAGLTCREIVYAVAGNCDLLLSDLTSSPLPSGGDDEDRIIPLNLKLKEACGFSCGKCPECKDQPLVEETAGYKCEQIVEMLDGNCDVLLKDLGQLPENVPKLASLKHACPMSCGECTGGKPAAPPCQDHPQMEALGYSCELLLSYSLKQCNTKLSDMGVDVSRFPSDLGPLAVIGDACPATCKTCTSLGKIQAE